MFHHIDVEVKPNPRLARMGATVFNSMPFQMTSLHICYNNPIIRPFLAMTIPLLTTDRKARTRSHYGKFSINVSPVSSILEFRENSNLTEISPSPPFTYPTGSHLECLYALRSYGIYYFPESVSKEHRLWIETRRLLEKQRRNRSLNTSPMSVSEEKFQLAPNDVVFGRGCSLRDNPGNIRFRKIVESFYENYENSGRLEKACVVAAIVSIIEKSKGRFLRKTKEGGWEHVSNSDVKEKVHSAFRNMRKQKRRAGTML